MDIMSSPILDSDNESDTDVLVLDTDYDLSISQNCSTTGSANHKIASVWRDMVVGEQMEGCLTHLEVTAKTPSYTDIDDPNYKPTTNGLKRKRFSSSTKSKTKTENISKVESDLESNHVMKKRFSNGKDDFTKCNYKYPNSKGFINKRNDNDNKKQKCRILPVIDDSEEKTMDQFLNELCTNLHEHNRVLMTSVVSKLDKQIILEKYTETCLIEANGGQMIKNGDRRRTSGGIFFNLIKEDKSIPNTAKKDLYGCNQNEEKQKKKKREKLQRRIKKEKLKKSLELEKKKAEILKKLDEELEILPSNCDMKEVNSSDTTTLNETEFKSILL